MIEDPYTQEELSAAIARVIEALSVEGQGKAAVAFDALAFVAAMLYDLDPTGMVPSHLRKAAQDHSARVLVFLKYLRRHAERTGTHFAEAIGGTVEIDPDLLPELTMGMTKQ